MSTLERKCRYKNLVGMSEDELCRLLPDGRVAGVIKNQIGSILVARSNASAVALRAVAEYCNSQKLGRLVSEKLTQLGETL